MNANNYQCKTKTQCNIKQTTIFFKTLICPSCGRKLSANYRLVKGVSKIYHIIIAELIPLVVQSQIFQ
jgi:hypothetical protein